MPTTNQYRYSIVQNKTSGMDAIMLLDDPFEGIIVSYTDIDVAVDEEQSSLNISFGYEILNTNHKGFNDPKPFEDYLGKLLEHILHAGIEEELQHDEGTA
jgi:hypothetical protein